jgi:predicted RNA methylase
MAIDLRSTEIDSWRLDLARGLLGCYPDIDENVLTGAVQRIIDAMLFVRACETRAILPQGALRQLCAEPAPVAALQRLGVLRDSDPHYGVAADRFPTDVPGRVLTPLAERLYAPSHARRLAVMPPENLGHLYEQALGRALRIDDGGAVRLASASARRAAGVYYTPPAIVDYLIHCAVAPLFAGHSLRRISTIQIVDPACGSGSFLLGVYRYLLDWYRDAYLRAGAALRDQHLVRTADGWQVGPAERLRILERHVYGVDLDPHAVALTRRALYLEALQCATPAEQTARLDEPAWPDLDRNLRCGNALVGTDLYQDESARDLDADAVRPLDWPSAFPTAFARSRPGFDVVIGNPPWGQKGIEERPAVKEYLRHHFESLSGIYDLFRPFVEQGVRLLRRRTGHFGMVLPDVVLLKDYVDTRRYLLDHLALTHIDWWGMAFSRASIDVATIVGIHARAGRSHSVAVCVHEHGHALSHRIPQRVFDTNDRHVFNLMLTEEKRHVVDRLAELPRLERFFEAHEGVHSGNMRDELFVDRPLDDSCRPLYFGRDELSPFHLRWRGRYLRLDALPDKKTRERYANLGQQSWFERDKILVRRTGDHVLAAVDRERRYASNNFFVVLPRADAEPIGLGLDGLCALLNSRFMTWYFRTIEPRRGRIFAELKIKHLTVFPLPVAVARAGACAALERLGAERARVAALLHAAPGRQGEAGEEQAALRARADELDAAIEREIYGLYGLRAQEIRIIEKS